MWRVCLHTRVNILGQMDKPDVDSIDGLSPAIAIDQKTTSRNPRSTVGTVTEINDYLRLLYARVGKLICPNDGTPIESQSLEQMVNRVMKCLKTKFSACSCCGPKEGSIKVFEKIQKMDMCVCASMARCMKLPKN